MRTYHKSWQNKRPGWTRRVRWYEGEDEDIRLCFEDTRGKINVFFKDAESAQTLYEEFMYADVTTDDIRARYPDPDDHVVRKDPF